MLAGRRPARHLLCRLRRSRTRNAPTRGFHVVQPCVVSARADRSAASVGVPGRRRRPECRLPTAARVSERESREPELLSWP